MTRRKAAHWLSPMRECLQHSLTSGEAYFADGYPVWPAVDRCKTTWHRVAFAALKAEALETRE